MALSRVISEILNVENITTMKSQSGVKVIESDIIR